MLYKIGILRNGGKDLPILCKVYTGMTVEQEALLFAEQNGFSAPLTAGIKLRAKVVGGDAISKAFLAATNRVGLSLNYDSQQLIDYRIGCVGTAFRLYKQMGEPLYCETMRLIVAAWEGKPDSFRASVLKGMMHFVELYHGEFSEERLLRALGSIHPVDIYRIGQDDPAKLRGWKKYVFPMLKEGFYHRPLTVIRPIDIENFLKGMRRDGRSDSYISKARGMLYQIFQKAEANDLVRRNPVRLAEKMRASGTAKRKEAFTTAEVAHLMKVLPDDRMGLSIRLLLGTGMRMQELLALEPQFIEEDGSVIHIRQAVKVVKGTVSIGSPKSKDSIRDIPVPLNVRSCAIKLRDTTDQFIWESPKTGLPCNPTHFRDVFRKSLEEAGDVRLLTPHSCRHTYVSQMQALGVDIQTIQSIVGHADTEMTEHYLHVQESIRQSAIQLFSEAFSA